MKPPSPPEQNQSQIGPDKAQRGIRVGAVTGSARSLRGLSESFRAFDWLMARLSPDPKVDPLYIPASIDHMGVLESRIGGSILLDPPGGLGGSWSSYRTSSRLDGPSLATLTNRSGT